VDIEILKYQSGEEPSGLRHIPRLFFYDFPAAENIAGVDVVSIVV
jgi:hypothetical protein